MPNFRDDGENLSNLEKNIKFIQIECKTMKPDFHWYYLTNQITIKFIVNNIKNMKLCAFIDSLKKRKIS